MTRIEAFLRAVAKRACRARTRSATRDLCSPTDTLEQPLIPAIHCLEEMQARLNEIGFDAVNTVVEVVADQYAARRAGRRRPPADAEDVAVEIVEDLGADLEDVAKAFRRLSHPRRSSLVFAFVIVILQVEELGFVLPPQKREDQVPGDAY